MNTVGIFAGRGDVILAMSMALAFGVLIGWKAHGLANRIKQWRDN